MNYIYMAINFYEQSGVYISYLFFKQICSKWFLLIEEAFVMSKLVPEEWWGT